MYGLAPAGINIQVTTITGQGTIIGTFWGAVKMAVCKGPRSLDPTFWGHKGQYACHADVDASACVHSVSHTNLKYMHDTSTNAQLNFFN